LEIENIPPHARPYIVARLICGRLVYYDSYLTQDKAELVVDRLENAIVVKGE
jgi:hypothetical protein